MERVGYGATFSSAGLLNVFTALALTALGRERVLQAD